jgi:hypothetical protein
MSRLLAFLLCITIAACKKDKSAPPVTVPISVPVPSTVVEKGEVVFNNPGPKDITVRLFSFPTTYGGEGWVTIKAGTSCVIDNNSKGFKQGETYSFIWYTSDYTASNWYDSANHFSTETDYTIHPVAWKPKDVFTIDSTKPNQIFQLSIHPRDDLLYLFKNIDGATLWQSVAALDSATGQNIWNNLTANDQYLVLESLGGVHNSDGVNIKTKDLSANIVKREFHTDPFTSSPFFKIRMYRSFLTFDNEKLLMTCNLNPILPVSTTSTDTMYIKSTRLPVYYVMVKQP